MQAYVIELMRSFMVLQATNGVDPTRRLHLLGFCRSVQNLSDVVEDAVLQRGGQVMLHHIEIRR
jgi:hypothetical protein